MKHVGGTLVLAAMLGAASMAIAAERRCGWLSNPTPANLYLTDREATWIVSEQGIYAAAGVDTMGDMSRSGWVVTNGVSYGYGCACLDVTVDRRSHHVSRVVAASPRPLKSCRADRSLPRP